MVAKKPGILENLDFDNLGKNKLGIWEILEKKNTEKLRFQTKSLKILEYLRFFTCKVIKLLLDPKSLSFENKNYH